MTPDQPTEPETEATETEPAAVSDAGEWIVDIDDEGGQDADPIEVDTARVLASVEAILFITDAPISPMAIAAGIDQPIDIVLAALADIEASYLARNSGIELRRIADGVRLYTREDLAPVVEQYLREGQRTRLTQAALETVAVVAYRQPITRARISAIRGVSVDGVIRTLLTRGLIVEVGMEQDSNGTLYATTDAFLEKMGLASLDELPSLAPLLPELDGLDVESR
jgi:segregation and condensation protein B